MPLIDEQGNLFGVVNIFDALAIILVISVLAAGIVVLFPSGDEASTEERYITIELTNQPSYVADLISKGDVMGPTENGNNLTVTDVYIAPATGNRMSVTVRAKVDGIKKEVNSAITFRENVVLPGSEIMIRTDEYSVKGTIRNVDKNGRSLRTSKTKVTLEKIVNDTVADSIESRDTYQVKNTQIATVSEVRVFPTKEADKKHVVMDVELQTIQFQGAIRFGTRPVQIGTTIPLATDDYSIEARVLQKGGFETISTRVKMETTVTSSVSNSIEKGDTVGPKGSPVATVSEVRVFPTKEADKKHVVMDVELQTIQFQGATQFGTQPVQIGTTIPLATDDYIIQGTITNKDVPSTDMATKTVETTVNIKKVSPSIADAIAVGDEERIRGTTFATVVDKRIEPAEVILTSEGGNIFQRKHPQKKDIFLTVQLRVRKSQEGLHFHNRKIRVGDVIILELQDVTVQGHVININED